MSNSAGGFGGPSKLSSASGAEAAKSYNRSSGGNSNSVNSDGDSNRRRWDVGTSSTHDIHLPAQTTLEAFQERLKRHFWRRVTAKGHGKLEFASAGKATGLTRVGTNSMTTTRWRKGIARCLDIITLTHSLKYTPACARTQCSNE